MRSGYKGRPGRSAAYRRRQKVLLFVCGRSPILAGADIDIHAVSILEIQPVEACQFG